jgi:hypothetical protein
MKVSQADSRVKGFKRFNVSEFESVSETLDLVNPLTQMSARETFTEYRTDLFKD